MVYRPSRTAGVTDTDLVFLSGDFKYQSVTITRQSLVDFYRKVEPSKIQLVDDILASRDPNELMQELSQKYGCVPQGSIVVSPANRKQYTFRPSQSAKVKFLPPAPDAESYIDNTTVSTSRDELAMMREEAYAEQVDRQLQSACTTQQVDYGCGSSFLFGPEPQQPPRPPQY